VIMVNERDVITHKAYARVGLLGNPSDVYYGKMISFSLANFYATVTLRPSEELVIQPHPLHDLVQFSSLPQLVTVLSFLIPLGPSNSIQDCTFIFIFIHFQVSRLNSQGYYGGVRLLMAICKVFYGYCRDHAIELADANFTLSYDTNIPRQARALVLYFPFASFVYRVFLLRLFRLGSRDPARLCVLR